MLSAPFLISPSAGAPRRISFVDLVFEALSADDTFSIASLDAHRGFTDARVPALKHTLERVHRQLAT